MKPPKPLERHLQATVLRHLKKLREGDSRLAFRKRHGGPLGIAGDPDIHGVWAGVPFAIELKRTGEEPTVLQRTRIREWETAGALVGVVHDMNELQEILDVIQKKIPKSQISRGH